MTLEELKELLSTYGANDHERGALVVVTMNGQDVPIASAQTEYGVWDEQARAWIEPDRMTVRLSIEPEPCIVCGAPIIGREGHDDGCMVAPCQSCGKVPGPDNSGHGFSCPMMGGAWTCAVCDAAPYIPCDKARHAAQVPA